MLMAPPLVVMQSGSLRGTNAGLTCRDACSSESASAATFAPGSSSDGAKKGVQPMSGSRMWATRASSEALLMTSAAAPRAWRLAFVSCAVALPIRMYCVGTLSDGSASVMENDRLVMHWLPFLSRPSGGTTTDPALIPELTAVNHCSALHQLTWPKTSPTTPGRPLTQLALLRRGDAFASLPAPSTS